MDKSIRRNEICVIGQPRCDFVFSSTRTCFIAYGFDESVFEMTILRRILEERGIIPEEAGGSLAPAQNAFCAKICSKIITAQFCAVLINNETKDGMEVPNANVNMEYGLMLGFNKYVLVFQRASQKLPFNVAGLDTIKYSDRDFERLSIAAIDQAIEETRQNSMTPIDLDQYLESFLIAKKTLFSPVDNQGERNFFNLGKGLGFNLLNDYSGFIYTYFGNFTALLPEIVVFRVKSLIEILDGRAPAIGAQVQFGLATPEQGDIATEVFENMQIWVLVTSDEDKTEIAKALDGIKNHNIELFSTHDVVETLEGAFTQADAPSLPL